MSRCSPRRDDPDAFAPLRVDNGQYLTGDYAEQDRALLAISLTVVDPLDCIGVIKGKRGLLKADAMIPEILGCLIVIPFELVIRDMY